MAIEKAIYTARTKRLDRPHKPPPGAESISALVPSNG
jgi:hypothetical protein